MSAFDQLLKRVWTTKGARLNAARRLEKRHLWSTRTIAFLSSYLAAVSIFALANSGRPLSAIASTFLVFASILVLVVSLIEGQEDYRVKAERLHECAKQLLPLEIRLDNIKEQPGRHATELTEIGDEFVAVIARCPENHTPMDYDLFRSSNPKDFDFGSLKSRVYPLYYWTRVLWWYGAAIVLPPVALVTRWLSSSGS